MSYMYATHIPLSLFQRSTLTILSGLGALIKPERADLVAAFGEVTGFSALKALQRRMKNSKEGQEILNERPRITNEILFKTREMPEGTFGKTYANFMDERDFLPSDRPPVRFVDDEELAYIATRYREIHDLWHVLFNCPTDLMGEIALKTVEFTQTNLPMTGLAALSGPFKLNNKKRREYLFRHAFWSLHAGLAASDLITIYYEKRFQDKLMDVQYELGIIKAPFNK